MNTIGENLRGNQNVWDAIWVGSLAGRISGICSRCVGSRQHSVSLTGTQCPSVMRPLLPFWFPDSVLLCALLLPNASGNFLSKSFRWVNVVHPDDRAARLLVTALIVGVAYYAGAWVGFTTTFPGPGSARRHIFWPPNVILLAALLVTAPRWRWPCSLTAFAAHLLVHAQLGVSPAVMALPVQFAGNVLQAVIADVKSGGGLLAPVGEATKAVDEARLAITSNCCG